MVHKEAKINGFGYLKVLIILVAVFSILLSMASCDADTQDNDTSFMEIYEDPETLEHTSIKFLFQGFEPKNWPNVKTEIEKRCKDKLNLSLDFKWQRFAQYMNTVNVLGSSGEVYDAFVLGKPEADYPDFTQLVREGKLKDITQTFQPSAPSLYAKYTNEELKFAIVDGKLVAVPSLYPRTICTYMMADDALLEKYNIQDIKNFDEYGAYLKTIKENEPDLIPGTISGMTNTIKLFARASGYVIADEANRLVYKWDDPEMKLILWEKTPEFYGMINYILDWLKKGYLKAHVNRTKVTSFMYERMLSPTSQEVTYMTFFDAKGQEIKSNPMRVFYLYPEMQAQRDSPMGSFYFNGSFVFPADSQNTEMALRFLEWVQQDRDNYLLMTCGIEKSDYVLIDGQPTRPNGMDYASRTYMGWDGSWGFTNIKYEYGDAVEADGEINMKYPPHGVFYPNYSVMQQSVIDRQNTYKDFENKLGQGLIKDMTDVEAFVNKLDAIGSAELVEEAQRQMMAK